MRRRFRVLIVLASTILLVLVLNVGTAFAHPNGDSADDYDFPGAVHNNSDVLGPVDPLFFNGVVAEDPANNTVNDRALPGIFQGFETHSPMCTTHYFEAPDHTPPPE
jgi:hypothetical protein